jgi:preprotein translocase subunit SecG
MLLADIAQYFFGFTIFLVSVFMILLILVQRGRGGGLVGALGGPGGQSAFGTKAGDLFTRITIVTAAVWIVLLASAAYTLKEKDLPETGAIGDLGPTLTNPDADKKTESGATTNPATPPATSGVPATSGPATPATTPEAPAATPPADAVPAAEAPAAEAPAAEAPAAGTPAIPPADAGTTSSSGSGN